MHAPRMCCAAPQSILCAPPLAPSCATARARTTGRAGGFAQRASTTTSTSRRALTLRVWTTRRSSKQRCTRWARSESRQRTRCAAWGERGHRGRGARVWKGAGVEGGAGMDGAEEFHAPPPVAHATGQEVGRQLCRVALTKRTLIGPNAPEPQKAVLLALVLRHVCRVAPAKQIHSGQSAPRNLVARNAPSFRLPQEAVFRTVAAVLSLGNVGFVPDADDDEAARVEPKAGEEMLGITGAGGGRGGGGRGCGLQEAAWLGGGMV
eukprot:352133-Chlamydomonas_euryale.AAC.3